MPTPSTIKDHFHETRLITLRVITALALLALLLAGLVARLYWLQVIEHERFTTQSEANRVKLIALPPPRGLIFDREGQLLADNLIAFHLELIPEQVKDLEGTLAGIGKIIALTAEDLAQFHRQRTRARGFEPIPLRFKLSEEEVARFALEQHRFPGVDIATRLLRRYPHGASLAHVLGYTGRIDDEDLATLDAADYSGTTHIGKIGLEKAYESALHGHAGHQQVEVNAQGRAVRVLDQIAPEPGQNLHLNLDLRLQLAAEQALGEVSGALVAIEPGSGAVLALVSKPGFDPQPFVHGIASTNYRALSNDPERPLYDRALRGQYPPGSTIKPFMGLAGLHYGVSRNEQRYCPGYFQLAGSSHRYRDWLHSGHGTVNLERAITESCDVYFYELAQELGIERMHAFLARFGFGSRTGIDLPNELPGLLPSRAWKLKKHRAQWYQGETIIAGIGQGYQLATPLQLAQATATLAARGAGYAPRLARATEMPLSHSRSSLPRIALPGIEIGDEQWTRVITAMTEVMHGARGTARKVGQDAAYRMAGKTGTAQVFGLRQDQRYNARALAHKLHDHALFVGFAPAEAPRIAIALIVEHGGSGGHTAAPIARQVFDAWLLRGAS
jgi:penicillin-binding protein 2